MAIYATQITIILEAPIIKLPLHMYFRIKKKKNQRKRVVRPLPTRLPQQLVVVEGDCVATPTTTWGGLTTINMDMAIPFQNKESGCTPPHATT